MSNVWGVSMMRDELDIVATTVPHMLTQVDRLIVADNLSSDGTGDYLDLLAEQVGPERLIVVSDPEPAYYQAEKMTKLARQAIEMGATWVVPFDADEWWYSPFHPRVADALEAMPSRVTGATADIYDHVATALDDTTQPPELRYGWRRVEKLPLHKMAGRAHPSLVVTQGNHHVRFDDGATSARAIEHRLVIRHFPYRSVGQFIQKVRNGAAAYAAAEGLALDAGAHWRKWGQYTDEELVAVFTDWYWRDNPRDRHVASNGDVLPPLIFDPAP